jgi:hypothetical protein
MLLWGSKRTWTVSDVANVGVDVKFEDPGRLSWGGLGTRAAYGNLSCFELLAIVATGELRGPSEDGYNVNISKTPTSKKNRFSHPSCDQLS